MYQQTTFKIAIDFTNTLIRQTKLALGTLMHYTTRERESIYQFLVFCSPHTMRRDASNTVECGVHTCMFEACGAIMLG